MALDTDIKKMLNDYNAKNHLPYSSHAPADLRRYLNQSFKNKAKSELIKVERVETRVISGPHGPLKLRLYTPHINEDNSDLPAFMYFHGGGFVIRDDMDVYDQTCRMISMGTQCMVIAVDFSLAPEHPFPAAPEDCYAATCWVQQHTTELNIDLNRIGVWGESCGGNLATVIAMMARDRKGPKLKCQVLITAMLDYNFETNSYRTNGQGDYILTEDTMRWFWEHYLSNNADQKNPYALPLRAKNLKDLPPALIITVEYDPLRDEGLAYAQELQKAGVATDYVCYPGLIHGFFDHVSVSKRADQSCQAIMSMAKKMIF